MLYQGFPCILLHIFLSQLRSTACVLFYHQMLNKYCKTLRQVSINLSFLVHLLLFSKTCPTLSNDYFVLLQTLRQRDGGKRKTNDSNSILILHNQIKILLLGVAVAIKLYFCIYYLFQKRKLIYSPKFLKMFSLITIRLQKLS